MRHFLADTNWLKKRKKKFISLKFVIWLIFLRNKTVNSAIITITFFGSHHSIQKKSIVNKNPFHCFCIERSHHQTFFECIVKTLSGQKSFLETIQKIIRAKNQILTERVRNQKFSENLILKRNFMWTRQNSGLRCNK